MFCATHKLTTLFWLQLTVVLASSTFLVACDSAIRQELAGGGAINPTAAVTTFPPLNVATRTPSKVPPLTRHSPTALPSSLPRLVASSTVVASPLIKATADPYQGLAISDLASRSYGGGELVILDTLEVKESYTRYLITYPSDNLTIYGFMNVPNEGDHFPVAIVLHGYIAPEDYQTLTYTTRYADVLAEAGYFVIHPNLRGFPPSDSGDDHFRTGLAIDVLNLISIIRTQSQDPLGYLRRADTENIHLWGHSMGGGIVLRVITVNNEPYIRAAVLYSSMSGDEVLNYEQIKIWSDGLAGDLELSAPPTVIAAISPINFLERIRAPISIHHSQADQVVPSEWSDSLCQQLKELNHPVECHVYQDLPHTFQGAGEAVFIERTIDFFARH
jgi:dienelactone hydrolase